MLLLDPIQDSAKRKKKRMEFNVYKLRQHTIHHTVNINPLQGLTRSVLWYSIN